jgi:hypothetical protein
MAIDEKQLIALLTNFKDEIIQSVDHRLGIRQEDFQHKLDLVVEGQQMLAERLDRVEDNLKGEICKVDQRVTAMSAELAEHRRDTEAHRKEWQVRED